MYLHVPASVTLARALQQDAQPFGTDVNLRRRYLPGQVLYRQEAARFDQADIVLDNSHPADPHVLTWPTDG